MWILRHFFSAIMAPVALFSYIWRLGLTYYVGFFLPYLVVLLVGGNFLILILVGTFIHFVLILPERAVKAADKYDLTDDELIMIYTIIELVILCCTILLKMEW